MGVVPDAAFGLIAGIRRGPLFSLFRLSLFGFSLFGMPVFSFAESSHGATDAQLLFALSVPSSKPFRVPSRVVATACLRGGVTLLVPVGRSRDAVLEDTVRAMPGIPGPLADSVASWPSRSRRAWSWLAAQRGRVPCELSYAEG